MAVAAGYEGLNIDGLDLNDQVNWTLRELQVIPPKKKLNWATSALSDGSAVVGDEDHYENGEMIGKATLAAQPDMDTALSVLNQLTTKLQKARVVRGGLPAVWTPHDSTKALTMYVLEGEIEELPMTYEDGWWQERLTVVFHLYLRPFLYGNEVTAGVGLSDAFLENSVGNGLWRFDTGSGTVTTGFGIMAFSSTVQKRLYRPVTTANQTLTMRFKIGTVVSGSVGVMKRIDASNYVQIRLNPGVPNMVASKVVAGAAAVALSTVTTPTIAASTHYWMQASVVGDDISVSLYADADNPLTQTGITALATTSYTLTGADSTLFGATVKGNPGISITPGDTSAQVRSFNLANAGDITGAEPMLSMEVEAPEGDVPAEARLVVTEGSSQTRSHAEWGLESRNYDSTQTPMLLIDSAVMSTSGLAGSQVSVGGTTYNPAGSANDAITASPLSPTVPVAVCSTGNHLHIGAFKVKARVSGSSGVQCRLAWRVADGSYARNDYSEMIAGAYREVDLGTIVIPEAGVGTQTWEGRIEAFGTGSITVDYVELFPLEKYGVARAPLQPIIPTVYTAFDTFIQTTGNLNAKTPDSGAAWVTSGSTTDFTVNATANRAERVKVSDADLNTGRYAVVGSTNYAGIQVQCDMDMTTMPPTATDFDDDMRWGLLLRYVDANNWFLVTRQLHSTFLGSNGYAHTTRLRVHKRVAGTATSIKLYDEGVAPNVSRTLIASVDAAGVWQVFSYHTGSKQPAQPQLSGQDAVLATSGALQNGKIGLYDANLSTQAQVRTFDNFAAFAPTSDAVLYSGKAMEIRSDRTERQSSASASVYGKVPMYRGSRFFVPQGQTSRLAVKARRSDVGNPGLPDENITDSLTAAVYTTPRWLVAPA